MWLRAKVISRPSGVTRRSGEQGAGVVDQHIDARLARRRSPRRPCASRHAARDPRDGARWPSPGAFASILRIVACARASSRATKTMRAPSPASASDRGLADARSRAGGDDGLALHRNRFLLVSPSSLRHLSALRRRKRAPRSNASRGRSAAGFRWRSARVMIVAAARSRRRQRTDQWPKTSRG